MFCAYICLSEARKLPKGTLKYRNLFFLSIYCSRVCLFIFIITLFINIFFRWFSTEWIQKKIIFTVRQSGKIRHPNILISSCIDLEIWQYSLISELQNSVQLSVKKINLEWIYFGLFIFLYNEKNLCVTSEFPHGVIEILALLGCYAT